MPQSAGSSFAASRALRPTRSGWFELKLGWSNLLKRHKEDRGWHRPLYAMTKHDVSGAAAPDSLTLAAFIAAAAIAGANAVAVRVGLAELAPFWGAAFRFLAAAAILVASALAMGRAFPRGQALLGVSLYGLLTFGLVYLFLYWALREATAGTVMVAFAITPLFTHILAGLQRIERITYRGLAGALIAGAGIALVFADKMGSVSFLSLAAILAAALAAAESPIVIKRFPHVDPVVTNGVGMVVGGLLLLAVSLIAREPWILPTTLPVQLSLIYLILVGSIGFFLLFLFVLGRWTASASIYLLLLAPLAAVALDLIILGDAPTPLLIVGGCIALAGVYIGTMSDPH
jgi:drug/metabolite transporter (DMT)-like permease